MTLPTCFVYQLGNISFRFIFTFSQCRLAFFQWCKLLMCKVQFRWGLLTTCISFGVWFEYCNCREVSPVLYRGFQTLCQKITRLWPRWLTRVFNVIYCMTFRGLQSFQIRFYWIACALDRPQYLVNMLWKILGWGLCLGCFI